MGSLKEESDALKRSEAIIAWWARKFQRSLPLELEDLIQEGQMQFVLAFRSYKPEMKVSFETYLGSVLKNHYLNLVTQQGRRKRQGEEVSLDKDIPLSESSQKVGSLHDLLGEEDPGFARVDRRQLHEAVQRAVAKLPPRTQTIIAKRFVDESTYDAIAKDIGVCGQRVRDIVKKAGVEIEKRLREQGLSDEAA